MKVEAKWTGKYPNYCSGQWILKVNNIDVSHLIPEELRNEPMNTYRDYMSWNFTPDWEVENNYYEDGLFCDEWLEENEYWLEKISTDPFVWVEIYEAINSQDWRYGSCGGCI